MQVHHFPPDLLAGMRSKRIPSPAQQDNIEVRLLTLFITWSFINDLVGPICYVFGFTPSLLHKVAVVSHGPWLVGGAFILAMVLTLPHAIVLTFMPSAMHLRWPRKLATAAAALVLVTWAYMAVQATKLDFPGLQWLYLRQGACAFFLAFLYALSLNAQLLRRIYAVMQEQKA